MKITVHSDPSTGQLIYEYKEEPKKLTPEEKEKEDAWFNDIMESSKIHNQLMHRLIDSFWTLNIQNFYNTWNEVFKEYHENKKLNHESKTEKEIIHDFKSSFVTAFINSMHSENNINSLKDNIHETFSVWDSQLNGEVFILLVWQLNLKEHALSLLEKTSCNFNSEIYDYVQQTFIKDFRQRELPLDSMEKKEILEEEKINFLQIQKTYCTFKKLNDQLIPKNTKSKSNKI